MEMENWELRVCLEANICNSHRLSFSKGRCNQPILSGGVTSDSKTKSYEIPEQRFEAIENHT